MWKSSSTFAVILACCTEHSPAVRGAVSVLTPCSVFPSFLLLWLLALHMTIKTWISGGKKITKEISIVSLRQQWDSTKSKLKLSFPYEKMSTVSQTVHFTNVCDQNWDIFLSNCLIWDCVRKILEETSQMKFGLQICQHLIIKHLQGLHNDPS